MMPYAAFANHWYFCCVERFLLDKASVSPPVVDADGAPAYHPPAWRWHEGPGWSL
jgi:hypothetical protein